MTDEENGVPDTDPDQLDPAGDIASAAERGDLDMALAEDADREQLEEFIAKAEAGEFDVDPGVEAAVRIARALLDDE